MEALGDLERGVQLELQGLECDSTSALAHVRIAVSFWNQRRYDDVIVWANQAFHRDPQHPFACEVLAGDYWKMGDLERFHKYLQRARERGLDANPQRERAKSEFELVLHYSGGGDLAAAFEHLQRMLDIRDRPWFISPWRLSGTARERTRGSTSVSHA
jgi:tetratricopeptide (TPR) repeat protein